MFKIIPNIVVQIWDLNYSLQVAIIHIIIYKELFCRRTK